MSVMADLESILDANSVFNQQPMSNYTSFNVGGPAQYLVLPRDFSQVAQVVSYCNEKGIQWHVVGKGTNLLISDEGLPGVVILIEENLAEVKMVDTTITAQAGASLQRVSSIARASSLTGLEFASGIPGTVGGAVAMNAGAYGGEIKDVLRRVLALSPQGDFVTYTPEEMELGYRHSVFQDNGHIVLEAEMELKIGDRKDIKERMREYSRRRKEKQPLAQPSAGSTFKRPPGHYAGQLIDECSLRGERWGGASVSQKHCGFIVNDNHATAQDIYNLIRRVQVAVKAKHGVELEPEVRIWGEFREE